MHLRTDIAPLPIAELAPIRFESTDPDEPFLLGCGESRIMGRCRLALAALRRDGSTSGDFRDAAAADVHALITPCGVVRTARVDGVLVTERIAVVGVPPTTVTQWTVDAGAELVLDGVGICRLGAGQTATAVAEPPAAAARAASQDRSTGLTADVEQAFHATARRLGRAVQAGLQLETSDGTGTALAWAKARLWTHARAGIPPVFPASLAALVVGRPDEARAHLESRRTDPNVLPLVAARYAAWTGDLHGIAEPALQLRAVTRLLQSPPLDETVAAAWLAGLGELERTATDLGDPRYAAELRALAGRHRAALAGRPLSAGTAAILTALRTPLPGTPPPPPSTGSDDVAGHAWLTWAALEQGLLRDGLAGWRRLLAEADAPIRGAWPHSFAATTDDAAATALFALTLVHGLLGLEPDAPRHRIRIAPRLVPGAETFQAKGIPCGDASVSLSVTADGPAVTLTLAQDEGAIPLTALLEPVIDGSVAGTFVDGRPARLNVRPYGDGTAVPVQLVLDAERTLRIQRTQRR